MYESSRRLLVGVVSTAGFLWAAPIAAQVRTPIATSVGTAPGAAPTNLRVASITATSVSLAWDGMAGAKSYLVTRTKTSDPACCQGLSGALASPGWQDTSLQPQTEYSYAVSVSYTDGSTGSTEIAAMTPALPLTFTLSADLLSKAEARLSSSPCNPTTTGGPGPASVVGSGSRPTGATMKWAVAKGAANYTVHRAPEGTTTWTFVGSTCGGPSSVYVSGDTVRIMDLAGGLNPSGGNYVYRVIAIGTRGETGWNTFHFSAPRGNAPYPSATVSGSTVTLSWRKWDDQSSWAYKGNAGYAFGPGRYAISSSFGFVSDVPADPMITFQTKLIYGVPLGTHTFSIRACWWPDVCTAPRSTTVTVAY